MVDPVSLDAALVRRAAAEELRAPADARSAGPAARGTSFADLLTDLVNETDRLQHVSDEAMSDFAAGRVEDVHDVMLAMNRADLSFRMMLEVRNKLMEAYTEVMRLPV